MNAQDLEQKERLVAELGRVPLVEDVEKAWRRIFESERQFATRLKQARQDAERAKTEIQLFLDEVQSITGLKNDSKIFWRIVSLTIGMRLRRAQIKTEDAEWREMQGPLAEFDDLEPMSDLPDDGDFERELIKRDPSLRQYKK